MLLLPLNASYFVCPYLCIVVATNLYRFISMQSVYRNLVSCMFLLFFASMYLHFTLRARAISNENMHVHITCKLFGLFFFFHITYTHTTRRATWVNGEKHFLHVSIVYRCHAPFDKNNLLLDNMSTELHSAIWFSYIYILYLHVLSFFYSIHLYFAHSVAFSFGFWINFCFVFLRLLCALGLFARIQQCR